MKPLRKLVRNRSISCNHHVICVQIIHVFLPIFRVVNQHSDVFSVSFDFGLPLAEQSERHHD